MRKLFLLLVLAVLLYLVKKIYSYFEDDKPKDDAGTESKGKRIISRNGRRGPLPNCF